MLAIVVFPIRLLLWRGWVFSFHPERLQYTIALAGNEGYVALLPLLVSGVPHPKKRQPMRCPLHGGHQHRAIQIAVAPLARGFRSKEAGVARRPM